ncbi:Uncharacterised protein [Mycobacteroides abscessus subsp. bolletii]|nr:Uncharacterised protein [Mycobacteroides abscessus subsp. bolletii]SKW89903.1 Uncharacterised protein [Mycobacteroides abscessus subsp. bolletii]
MSATEWVNGYRDALAPRREPWSGADRGFFKRPLALLEAGFRTANINQIPPDK